MSIHFDEPSSIERFGLKGILNTNQSIPNNSLTSIIWDNIEYDKGFYYDTSIIVPVDGVYSVSCSIMIEGALLGSRSLGLYVDDELKVITSVGSLSSAQQLEIKPNTWNLTEGSVVDFRVFQNSGSSKNVLANDVDQYTSFSINLY